ncbi:cytochrome P450 [Aspergillus clavatus NRRL 1]|uniref:Tryprostatin B 6-hydroxylase n=1 Tax=Aspergillus clavatus (strain ATCC 1007 / CBS 513.65 / DSM 816 / NCTC 3887 / NRRL 1 / QM 1276 / 107) TaxID=344612 RepID=A1CFM9_ASPCL|nr:benzoate 4-monooxygenase cytochrome P450 [Aspergillus clavatus NRRL 1]EAW11678.1 benzoate 4-monooxygenase cytochrome P450 [Aspergillus clavatus NRRL 1]
MLSPQVVSSFALRGLLLGLFALCCTTVGFVVHRLFFHPLAKYPGPWLAKVSNLYAGYHAWKGDLHLDMWKCHEKYGDFVRYGPNSLLVNTATGLHDIYGHGKNFRKAQRYAAMVHRAPNTLTVIDKKKHGKKRRVISQGFSDAALKNHEVVINEQIRQLLAQLKTGEGGKAVSVGSWSSPKNMGRFTDYFAFDVMSNIIFGVPWSTLRTPTYRFVPEVIEKSNVRVGVLAQAPEVTFMRLDKYLFPEAIKARDIFIRFVEEMLNQGIQVAATTGKGVFATLANATDPETGLPLRKRELGGESATLIVAGTDTSSTALAACFFYLSHNRSALERATAEVRSTFQSPEDIRMGVEMNQCVFLRACIEESMRMSPSAASSLWREAEEAGATVDGHYIPPGVDAGTCIYSIHHNPAYYPQPFTFRPERWIASECHTVKGDVSLARSAFNPFSIGPRSCIGKSLAYVELHLALANVLWAFDLRLASGDLGKTGEGVENAEYGRHRVNEYQLYDHLTAAKHGPYIEFSPRV